MCLTVKKFSILQTALRDKVVYKVISKVHEKDELIYITPYQHAKIQIGETYRENNIHKEKWTTGWVVEEGLHSLKYLKDANALSGHYSYHVVKCIIPKGAKYYKGVFGLQEYTSYVSTEIIYVELIN